MRVLVCGSRDWTDRAAIRRALVALLPGSIVVHGGARGADRLAGDVAAELSLAVEVYPANWDLLGRAAGVLRNQQMLDTGIDYVLAFPLSQSRGTWDMIRRARAAGVAVDVVRTGGVRADVVRTLAWTPRALLLAALAWAAAAATTAAQGPEESALWLARVCVHEAGFHSPRDCQGIYQVLRAVHRRGETLRETAARASPTLVGMRGRDRARMAWARSLGAEGHQALRWPARWPWARFRGPWLARLAEARELVAGRGPRACPRAPIAWGGPGIDDAFMARRNLRRIAVGLRAFVPLDCGRTRNRFWG